MKTAKTNYINKSFRKVTKSDMKYVELLNCLYTMEKYKILTKRGLMAKLLSMTAEILDKNEK